MLFFPGRLAEIKVPKIERCKKIRCHAEPYLYKPNRPFSVHLERFQILE
jgi:hypothetical protein